MTTRPAGDGHAEAGARPKEDQGNGLYAVEAAVFGVVGFGWLAAREGAFGGSMLDYACFSVMFYASLLSLACGVFLHRGRVQRAYVGVAAGVWHLYLYGVIAGEAASTSIGYDGPACVQNANPRGLVRAVLFGGVPLHELPAGVSLALLTVNVLVAAGGVGEGLWRLCAWSDVAALGVLVLHAALSGLPGMSPDLQGGGAGALWVLVGVHVLFLVFDVVWQRGVLLGRAATPAAAGQAPAPPSPGQRYLEQGRVLVQAGWVVLLLLEFSAAMVVASMHGLLSFGLILLFLKGAAHRGIVFVVGVQERRKASALQAQARGAEQARAAPAPPVVTADLVLGPAAGSRGLFSVVRFPGVREKKRS